MVLEKELRISVNLDYLFGGGAIGMLLLQMMS